MADMTIRTTTITLLLLVAAVGPAAGALSPGSAASGSAPHPADATTLDASDCEFPTAPVDATGRRVPVSERPERVVVLGPSGAQTLWEIGAADQVVGMPVNQYTAYLNGSAARTNVVTNWGRAVVETVIGLRPDLVLASNVNSDDAVESFHRAGIPVYKFREATSVADIYNKTALAGRLTGNCEGAAAANDAMRRNVTRVREAVAGRDRPSVFYPMGGGWTAGPGSFVHDVLVTAGAHNIAEDAGIGVGGGSAYGTISAEVVVNRTPTWLVVSYVGEKPDDPLSTVNTESYANVTAVAEENVIAVNSNYFSQPGPRVVRPLVEIATALHPEAMANATTGSGRDTVDTTTGAETTRASTTEAGTASTTSSTTEADSGTTESPEDTTPNGGAPGFGAVAALLAVVATLAVATGKR